MFSVQGAFREREPEMIRLASAPLVGAEEPARIVELLDASPVDFLVFGCRSDAAAERLEKQRREDPSRGFIEEFPEWLERLAPQLGKRGVGVLSGAGGLNPLACAREVRRRAPGLPVAVASYGDLASRIEMLVAGGHRLAHLETGEGIDRIDGRILGAAVPVGAEALQRALAAGAQVVVTGWPAGPALALAAAAFRFGWRPPDWNRLAAGAIAGHLLTGGSGLMSTACASWRSFDRLEENAFAGIELFEDGCLEIVRLPASAAGIDAHAVKEQLLSGVGNLRAFETPDCAVDLTHLAIEEQSAGRLRITGSRGAAPSGQARLWIAYQAGWKASGGLLYCWPEAFEKARAAERLLRRRLERLGLAVEEMRSEYIGVNACLGPGAPPVEDYPEVELRIRVRCGDRGSAERAARELDRLAAVGPPGALSPESRSAAVEEVIGFWPTAVPASELQAKVEVLP